MMNLPNRKRQRLAEYDYFNGGYYFVTICTHNRCHLFGEINSMNEIGIIAENELQEIVKHFECVKIDKYVIMPNHVHCIVGIGIDQPVFTQNDETERPRSFPTLSTIIGLYKSGVSKIVHKANSDITMWQKSYHDHVIRDEKDYQKIWQYIDENRMKWSEDCYWG